MIDAEILTRCLRKLATSMHTIHIQNAWRKLKGWRLTSNPLCYLMHGNTSDKRQEASLKWVSQLSQYALYGESLCLLMPASSCWRRWFQWKRYRATLHVTRWFC